MSDKSIIGLSRLVTLRQQVDTVARNIANQSTTGYKSEGLRFREYLTEAKEEDVRASPLRSLVADTAFSDFSAGPLQATGNSTDVAMIGDGFFVVAVPGGERYTRNGAFTLDAKGQLVTLGGQPVMTSTGPIRVSQQDGPVTIGPDGSISIGKGSIGRLRIVRFADQRQLSAESGGMFSAAASPTDVAATEVRLASGVLEGSNVRTVQEMSKLVAATRAYDQVAKAILRESDPNELKRLAGEE